MFTLYPDTEKELSFDTDYRPLPNFDSLSFQDMLSLLDNLEKAAENAFMFHSALLELALFDDIMEVKKAYITAYIRNLSSGFIAHIISSTKYHDIDKAIYNSLSILQSDKAYDMLIDQKLTTEPESISEFILKAYTGILPL